MIILRFYDSVFRTLLSNLSNDGLRATFPSPFRHYLALSGSLVTHEDVPKPPRSPYPRSRYSLPNLTGSGNIFRHNPVHRRRHSRHSPGTPSSPTALTVGSPLHMSMVRSPCLPESDHPDSMNVRITVGYVFAQCIFVDIPGPHKEHMHVMGDESRFTQ